MIYTNAIDLIKGQKIKIPDMVKLATVTSLSNGRAYVRFHGETTASSKLYPYIEGYKPAVNDVVLLIVQGETYIIVGKVGKDNIINNYYLTKTIADTLYLTKAVADTLYEPIGGGGGGSTPTQIENTKYKFGFNSSSSNVLTAFGLSSVTPFYCQLGNSSSPFTGLYVDEIQLTSGNILPSSDNASSIGTTTKMFKTGYFYTLGHAAESQAIQTLNVKNLNAYGNIIPNATNSRDLGSSSVKFKKLYVNGIEGLSSLGSDSSSGSIQNLYVKALSLYGDITPDSTNQRSLGSSSKRMNNVYTRYLYADELHLGTSSTYLSLYYGNSSNIYVRPSSNGSMDLGGSSYQFNKCYAKQFYQNGTAISTSDKRKKKNIKDIDDRYIEFFYNLQPALFKFKDGESGRVHSGFIAQEVEAAAHDSGIDNKELAFLCIDENGDYGLRYDELIAIQTKVIQDLTQKVDTLENRIARLEKIIEGGA